MTWRGCRTLAKSILDKSFEATHGLVAGLPGVRDEGTVQDALDELGVGPPGVRDEGLLESAVELPSQSFGGAELYPTLEEKGGAIGIDIAIGSLSRGIVRRS